MRRIRKVSILVFVAAMVVSVFGRPAPAHANFWTQTNVGYFKGLSESGSWGNVLPSWGGAPANQWNGFWQNTPGGSWPNNGIPQHGCIGDGWAIPDWIKSVGALENFIQCKSWWPQNANEGTGAAYIMASMIGVQNLSGLDFWQTWGEFYNRLDYAQSRGWINWDATYWCDPASPPRNTFYQTTRDDVAAEWHCPVNNSGVTQTASPAISIYNGNGDYYWLIRLCANPVGNIPPLMKPPADFNLTPSVTAQIKNGATPVSGNIAEPGNTVTFTYSVLNSGAADSPTTTCTYRQATYSGYSTAPPTTTFTPSGANCAPSRVVPGTVSGGNNVTVATETVTVTTDNTSICRSLTVNPTSNTNSGESSPAVACVFVAAKPFAKVYGGDLVAGGGVVSSSGTCTSNSGAAIIGWNQGVSPYQGAGVQYAAYALSTILGVATSVGNGAGAAAPPAGLSFANTSTNVANGSYGGSFGSVPCIPNYYGELPTAYNTISTASSSAALPNGVSYRNGDLQLTGGTISTGTRVSAFVKGNVYISGNITYGGSGSWTSANIPLFELVVSGNIYIAPGVTQLDGLYIAQSADGTTNGVVYTCATGLAAPVGLTSLAGSCGTTLTVNGAFVARQVQLMRTAGSLGTGSPAEVFNYNPTLWIAQPSGLNVSAPPYDSIASLPPVL